MDKKELTEERLKELVERQDRRINELINALEREEERYKELLREVRARYRHIKEEAESREEEPVFNIRELLPLVVIGIIGWYLFQKKGIIQEQ